MHTKRQVLGNIYILSNPAMPGLLKIGFTKKPKVSDRADELSKLTAIPLPFKIEYELLVDNPKQYEHKLHKELKIHRVSQDREFFRVELDEAIIAINKIVHGKDNQLFSLVDSMNHLLRLYEEHPDEFTNTEHIEQLKIIASRYS